MSEPSPATENHPSAPSPRQHGVQPVDALLNQMQVANHEVVAISSEHLTHKMVQKARKGRQLTRNVQNKVLNAVNALRKERGDDALKMTDLFTYKG